MECSESAEAVERVRLAQGGDEAVERVLEAMGRAKGAVWREYAVIMKSARNRRRLSRATLTRSNSLLNLLSAVPHSFCVAASFVVAALSCSA